MTSFKILNMFRQLKNIDSAFRYIRLFSLVFLITCLLLSGYVSCKAYELAASAGKRIYILSNGKVMEAYAAERKDNIPVEARDHVKMFHHYFFTLDPDDKVIGSNIGKALYLADASAKQQYDDLKENGYYAGLVSGNISQEITEDSIRIDIDRYPYYFLYKGKQKIIRPTSITMRRIVTEGFLRNVSRSDNDPHGFLIEKWRITENSDISTQNR